MPNVQLAIWIIAISVVAGPILLGFLLHRLGFSRAVTLGVAMAIVGGGTILLSREPFIDTSTRQDVATAPTAFDVDETADPGAAATDPRAAGGDALQREKAAHEKTRRALDAANARIATLNANRSTPASAPPGDRTGQSIRAELEAAQRRLAIANAEIERLRTAVRAAEPVATANPLPATPQPFANTPAPAQRAATPAALAVKSDEIATGAMRDGSDTGSQGARPGQTLAEASRSRRFVLVKLADDELVEGRRGSYYRITCPGAGDKPLRFGAGDYTFNGGFGALDACVKAVESLLLKPLPPDGERRLYVQGYASFRGFLRPKLLPMRDMHLRSIFYLQRIKGRDRYAAQRSRQATGPRFANAELPNLRAASVAHRIETLTNRSIKPEILEGELKPGGDAASQSFALILQMPW